MKILHTPVSPPKPPKKPSWWSGFFKETGTVVEHNGVNWILLESWSWMDYDGRDWYRYTLEVPPECKMRTTEDLNNLLTWDNRVKASDD